MLAQEYGRYFGMNTVCFRGGCLTGAGPLRRRAARLSLVPLQGRGRRGGATPIFGYKGKQVRDQIHSRDVIGAMAAFIDRPRSGEVYNLGGGKGNSVSILESIDRIHQLTGERLDWTLPTRTASATTSSTTPTSAASAPTIPSGT